MFFHQHHATSAAVQRDLPHYPSSNVRLIRSLTLTLLCAHIAGAIGERSLLLPSRLPRRSRNPGRFAFLVFRGGQQQSDSSDSGQIERDNTGRNNVEYEVEGSGSRSGEVIELNNQADAFDESYTSSSAAASASPNHPDSSMEVEMPGSNGIGGLGTGEQKAGKEKGETEEEDSNFDLVIHPDGSVRLLDADYDRPPSPCTYYRCNCEGDFCREGYTGREYQRRHRSVRKGLEHLGIVMGRKENLLTDPVKLEMSDLSSSEPSVQWVPPDLDYTGESDEKRLHGYTIFVNTTARRLERERRNAARFPKKSTAFIAKWLEKRARETERGKLKSVYSKYQKSVLANRTGGPNRRIASAEWTTTSSIFPRIGVPFPSRGDPSFQTVVENMTCCERRQYIKDIFNNSKLCKRLNVTYDWAMDMVGELMESRKMVTRTKRLARAWPLVKDFDSMLLVDSDWEPGPDDLYDYRYPIPIPIEGKKFHKPLMPLRQAPVYKIRLNHSMPKVRSDEESIETEDLNVDFDGLVNPKRKRKVPRRRPFDAEGYYSRLEARLGMSKKEKRDMDRQIKPFTEKHHKSYYDNTPPEPPFE